MYKYFLVFIALFSVFLVSSSALADSVTFGNAKFDFGAASSALTPEQQAFFDKYKEVVNKKSEADLMLLIDESVKACPFTSHTMLTQDLKHTLEDGMTVRFFPAADDIAQQFELKGLAYLAAKPTVVLGINSKKLMLLRPMRQTGNQFKLIPYCLTEKGNARLNQKEPSQKPQTDAATSTPSP